MISAVVAEPVALYLSALTAEMVLLERLSSKEKQKPHMTALRKVVVVALGIFDRCVRFRSSRAPNRRRFPLGRAWHPSGVPSHDPCRQGRRRSDAGPGFSEALAAPRMAHPTCDNLGLTADWLRANAQRLLSEHDTKFSDEASKLQKLQIDIFSDVGSSTAFYLGSSTVSTPMTTR